MEPFYVTVESVRKGQLICEILADYDRFQFENNVKPDYSNVGGVSRFEDGEWCDIDDS